MDFQRIRRSFYNLVQVGIVAGYVEVSERDHVPVDPQRILLVGLHPLRQLLQLPLAAFYGAPLQMRGQQNEVEMAGAKGCDVRLAPPVEFRHVLAGGAVLLSHPPRPR